MLKPSRADVNVYGTFIVLDFFRLGFSLLFVCDWSWSWYSVDLFFRFYYFVHLHFISGIFTWMLMSFLFSFLFQIFFSVDNFFLVGHVIFFVVVVKRDVSWIHKLGFITLSTAYFSNSKKHRIKKKKKTSQMMIFGILCCINKWKSRDISVLHIFSLFLTCSFHRNSFYVPVCGNRTQAC